MVALLIIWLSLLAAKFLSPKISGRTGVYIPTHTDPRLQDENASSGTWKDNGRSFRANNELGTSVGIFQESAFAYANAYFSYIHVILAADQCSQEEQRQQEKYRAICGNIVWNEAQE